MSNLGRHVMIDLETMGNNPDAAIVAIGAVEFELTEDGGRVSSESFEQFYMLVDLQSSINAGLKVDGSTVYWWLQQSDEARKGICGDERYTLDHALYQLSAFLLQRQPDNVWARGTDFDVSILRTAYRAVGLSPPWKYNAGRDSRTFFAASPPFDAKDVPRAGVSHHALYDAMWEAAAVLHAHSLALKNARDLARLRDKIGGYDESHRFAVVIEQLVRDGRVSEVREIDTVGQVSHETVATLVHNVGESGACDCNHCIKQATTGMATVGAGHGHL